jgi:hypothetical protein
MNSVMAVGTNRINAETTVESRNRTMTAKTKLPLALEQKHMSVGRAMGLMAGGAAFYKYGTVLEDVGVCLIGMTFCALLLLESTQFAAGEDRGRRCNPGSLPAAGASH